MSGSNPGLVALSDHGLSVVRLQGPNTEGVPIGMSRGNGWHCGPTFVGNPLYPRHFQQPLLLLLACSGAESSRKVTVQAMVVRISPQNLVRGPLDSHYGN